MIIGSALEGRTALITGAASGIGRASALAFAHGGARVVVSDVDTDGGQATVRQIIEAGGEAVFIPADVAQEDDVARLVTETVTRYGRLDCALNNAGISSSGGLTHELAVENWSRVLAVNLTGVWPASSTRSRKCSSKTEAAPLSIWPR